MRFYRLNAHKLRVGRFRWQGCSVIALNFRRSYNHPDKNDDPGAEGGNILFCNGHVQWVIGGGTASSPTKPPRTKTVRVPERTAWEVMRPSQGRPGSRPNHQVVFEELVASPPAKDLCRAATKSSARWPVSRYDKIGRSGHAGCSRKSHSPLMRQGEGLSIRRTIVTFNLGERKRLGEKRRAPRAVEHARREPAEAGDFRLWKQT
jgi:hypothetical protein